MQLPVRELRCVFSYKQKKPLAHDIHKIIVHYFLIIAVLAGAMEYQSAYDDEILLKLPFDASFYAPLFLFLIMAFCIADNTITALLSWKPFVYLGEISFSVYIMQSPVSRILQMYLRRQNYSFSPDAFICLYIGILIIIGMILLHAVERPISKYARKISAIPKGRPTRQ